jgi:acetyltransferase-like isoleucine patch superfamily enzyme
VKSHGTGQFTPGQLKHLGERVVIEPGVLIFHPENVSIGDDVYVGHGAMLKGYYKNEMVIGRGTWIGQGCFFHSAGGIRIGANVGVGPQVKIFTSWHIEEGRGKPILHSKIEFAPVMVEDDVDLGIGTTVMPGVTIGRGAQIGAGAVITRDVPAYEVWIGVPARKLRDRP